MVYVAGEKREILCDYEHADFIYQSDFDCETSDFFNIKADGYDYYVYLGEYNNFRSQSSLSRLIYYIEFFVPNGCKSCYSDITVTDNDGKKIFTRHVRSFYSDNTGFIYNNPFIVEKQNKPQFKKGLKRINLHEAFNQVASGSLGYATMHIPEALFTSRFTNESYDSLADEELKTLNDLAENNNA